MQITLCKARNTATRHIQGKRDVRQEVKRAAGRRDEDSNATILDQIDSDGPTPVEAALMNESLEPPVRR